MKRILVLFFISVSIILGQTKDPDAILNKVKENFNKIKDYQVDVYIKIDVSFLKVPDSNAKIYFKQPDKVKIKSDQFALLPKEGLNFSPVSFLKKKYTAIFSKEDTVYGYKTYVIKTIPLEDNSDVVLTTFWIDEQKYVIRKVESSTKVNGTFTLYMKYDTPGMNYPLPSQMIFTFNTERLRFRSPMRNNIGDNQQENQETKKPEENTGKVIVSYNNYIVNKGIPDSLFEKSTSPRQNK